MFSDARRELGELVELTRDIATYDATLAADRTIVPTDESRDERRRKERRKMALMLKYELI
jgi:hypothetical protein